MVEYDLTQTEANYLQSMAKHRVDDTQWTYPGLGGGLSIPLVSENGKEHFFLDIRRGRVNLAKGSYQNRGRRVVVLARLCFGGGPHENPDGRSIPSPHIHQYCEGYGDKWAYPLPSDVFENASDQRITFRNFLNYCNITKPPNVRLGLSV